MPLFGLFWPGCMGRLQNIAYWWDVSGICILKWYHVELNRLSTSILSFFLFNARVQMKIINVLPTIKPLEAPKLPDGASAQVRFWASNMLYAKVIANTRTLPWNTDMYMDSLSWVLWVPTKLVYARFEQSGGVWIQHFRRRWVMINPTLTLAAIALAPCDLYCSAIGY